MPNPSLRSRTARALLTAGFTLLIIAGCAAPSTSTDGTSTDGTSTDTPVDAPVEVERPEGLDASLPVPPGDLVTATPEASAWEYIYSGVATEEASEFADLLVDSGFALRITVDSGGVEKWYLQSTDWAVNLELTHATEELRYWVDPIIE